MSHWLKQCDFALRTLTQTFHGNNFEWINSARFNKLSGETQWSFGDFRKPPTFKFAVIS